MKTRLLDPHQAPSARPMQNLPLKIAVCALITVCLVLGLVGLVLPLIPGLVFLAIAALIAARHFPSVRAVLSRSPRIGAQLDRADRFFGLTPPRQLQVGALLCLKLLLDAAALVTSAAASLLHLATGTRRAR